MTTFEIMIDRYAQLVVKMGVNIQKEQTLVVFAPLFAADFVRILTKKAYEAGAKNVYIDWTDDAITQIKYESAPIDSFKDFPLWKTEGFEKMAENGAAFISIRGTNPELLTGVDPDRIALNIKSESEAFKKLQNYVMENYISWSLVAVPSLGWAQKVFPDSNDKQKQIEDLWNAIFSATRVDLDNPIRAWQAHNENLRRKLEYLNTKKYRYLHYEAPGTKLTIELPSKHIWHGGQSITKKGVLFNANIPTEEVFTVPLKEGVNGVVQSTKPLSYGGNLIENFTLTFRNGRIVNYTAETGYEVLKKLIKTDNGSHYLGEVALVSHQSPISQTNLIFYETLFDENASSHLAIGNAYSFCIKNGENMTREELVQRGLNYSLIHVDFMIGSSQLNISGERIDKTIEPLIQNGDWAF